MPTYQYACNECGEPLEVVQSFTDDSLTECPSCGGRLRKLFNAVGIVFKGSGFYRTDSRASSSSSESASSSDKSSAGAGKSDTAKSDTGKSDTAKSDSGKSDTSKSTASESGKSDSSGAAARSGAGKAPSRPKSSGTSAA